MGLSKEEFVKLCMEYQRKKRQQKQREKYYADRNIMSFIMDNHYRIERRCRGLRRA